MELYLKVLKGTRKDDVFKIAEGITLGRSKADINLKDAKSSSIHGEIQLEKGALVFCDNNSTNGTFVDGERIEKITLKPGVHFNIGSTEIEVVTELDLKKPSKVELSEWQETLYFQLSQIQTVQNEQPIYPLPQNIKIKIDSGLMRGEEFVLGYGPRLLGGGASDVFVAGESFPLLKIETTKDGAILISDQTGDGLVISGQVISSIELVEHLNIKCGDLIVDVSIFSE